MELTKREQEAMNRIYESLGEYEGSRYAQHVLAEDLEILLKLVEKCTKK